MASPGQVVYGRPWLRWVPWLGKPTYPNPAWWKEATRITYGQELHELRHVVDFRLRPNLTYFANNWYGPGRGVARTVLEHRGYSIQAAVDGQRVLVPLRAIESGLQRWGWLDLFYAGIPLVGLGGWYTLAGTPESEQ